VSLDAMAKKVDEDLFRLYGTCYLSPTLLMHATPFGLDLRFRKTEPVQTHMLMMPSGVGIS
jgi:hypothetical protein